MAPVPAFAASPARDEATGTLTSPLFRIERRLITFLIGGGGHAGKTCINLLIDGRIVRTATGKNTAESGEETLVLQIWDIAKFTGRDAQIQIVDAATGTWGHINIAQIVMTDTALPAWLPDRTRTLALVGKYLNLPIKKYAPWSRVRINVKSEKIREFHAQLADTASGADFWAPVEIAAWQGVTAVITVDFLPENSSALALLEPGDTIKNAADLYREKARPSFIIPRNADASTIPTASSTATASGTCSTS